ncbi:hypothetical protein G7046_g7761 [Stylonectria norvegica]|nr:hypothetical protein G7046_g7761 [Stylonectria norvegica]
MAAALDIEKVAQPTDHDFENGDIKAIARHDGDMALRVYELDVTEEELAGVDQKKLMRKIDLHLIPIMCVAMMVFTIDKSTLSYSSIMGIQEDTNLTDDQYSWLGSIFSLGYLVSNIPCAFIIQKVSLSKWVAVTMSLWGTVLACMAAAPSFGSLFAIRLILGFLEASITPVFLIMTGMWYSRPEQAYRMGLWYSGIGFATIIGSPIAWALDSPTAATGILSNWQLLYVVFGSLTVALAVCFYFVVPDSPLTAKFLTPAERVVAIQRIRTNQQGIGNRHFKAYQAFELVKDPRTYLYFAIQFIANIGYGAVGTWGSKLIVSLGFDHREALLVTMPHGATTLVAVLSAGYLAAKMNDRTLWAGIAALMGAVFGACLYGIENNRWASLICFYFQHMFVATYILTFSLVSANTAGHTKKVLTNAVLLLGATSGSLTGPQITKNDKTFKKVKLACLWAPAVVLLLLCIVRLLNIRENRRRDKDAESMERLENSEFMDLTDGENKEFSDEDRHILAETLVDPEGIPSRTIIVASIFNNCRCCCLCLLLLRAGVAAAVILLGRNKLTICVKTPNKASPENDVNDAPFTPVYRLQLRVLSPFAATAAVFVSVVAVAATVMA